MDKSKPEQRYQDTKKHRRAKRSKWWYRKMKNRYPIQEKTDWEILIRTWWQIQICAISAVLWEQVLWGNCNDTAKQQKHYMNASPTREKEVERIDFECRYRSRYILGINDIFSKLYNKMIKKDYFPTQEAPDWVKESVMRNINIRQKNKRLGFMIRHRILVPTLALLIVVVWWYVYLNNWNDIISWIWTSNNDRNMKSESNLQWNDVLLQKKIMESESLLESLDKYSNAEESIAL